MLRKTIIPKEIYLNLKFGKWKMEKIHNFEKKKLILIGIHLNMDKV